MSADYAAKERAFLDSLKPDTGRDLAEWMQAIAAAGLPHRNDTIDWLRQQGFPFSRASWLERIHHNGGRPIYAGAGERPAATRRPKATAATTTAQVATTQGATSQRAPAQGTAAQGVTAQGGTAQGGAPHLGASRPAASATVTRLPTPADAPTAQSAASGPVAAASPASGSLSRPPPDVAALAPNPAASAAGANGGAASGPPLVTASGAPLGRADVAALLAPAKAYRPLAQYLLAAIERAVPDLAIHAADGLLILAGPKPFAAILPGPRDIRLGLDAGESALGPHMLRSRLPGAPSAMAHTVVLDDARQVNQELVAVIEAARRRNNN